MKLILDMDSVKFPLTGIGRYTYELAKAFKEKDCFEQLVFVQGFKVLKEFSFSEEVACIDSEKSVKGHLLKLARGNRFAHEVFFMRRKYFLGNNLKTYKKFIFHGTNYFLPYFPGPKIVTIPDLSTMVVPQFHEKFKADLINKRIFNSTREADGILAISQYAAQEIEDVLGIPKQKIHVTPLAAAKSFYPRTDAETSSLLSKWNLQHGRYCLFTGTIEPRKNIDVLLDAYGGLPGKIRSVFPLVLCGYHGWKSEALHQRIKDLSDKGWVKYLGYVEDNNLPLLMAGARLFLYPSFYEGFGLPPLEAMQSGVPVIVSDRTSLPEVVGNAGIKLPPRDVEAWREEILQGLEDDSLRKQNIVHCLERAAAFSWEFCAVKTILAYSSMMGV